MYKSHLFCALRCYQSKLSPAIIEVFVHILKFSPAKKHKETFPLSRFLVTKSAAKVSKEDSRRPPYNHRRRARVSRASRAWQVSAARSRAEVSSFAIPHDFGYTTRANISHEKAEQIRARIVPPHTNTGDSVARICIFPCFYFKLSP